MGVAATRRSPQAERYEAEGHWEGRLLDALVRDGAAAWPERVAVVDGDVRLTYAALAELVERAAGALHALGVGPGDVVSFQLPNWWEAAVVHHATLRLGAVSNAIVPIYRAREVRFIVRQARAKVLVVPGSWRGFDHAADGGRAARRAGEPRARRRRARRAGAAAGLRDVGDELGQGCPGRGGRRSAAARRPPARRRGAAAVHLRHRGRSQGRPPHPPDRALREPLDRRPLRARPSATAC